MARTWFGGISPCCCIPPLLNLPAAFSQPGAMTSADLRITSLLTPNDNTRATLCNISHRIHVTKDLNKDCAAQQQERAKECLTPSQL